MGSGHVYESRIAPRRAITPDKFTAAYELSCCAAQRDFYFIEVRA